MRYTKMVDVTDKSEVQHLIDYYETDLYANGHYKMYNDASFQFLICYSHIRNYRRLRLVFVALENSNVY